MKRHESSLSFHFFSLPFSLSPFSRVIGGDDVVLTFCFWLLAELDYILAKVLRLALGEYEHEYE